MSEKRVAPRQRTYKGGSISFGTAPAVECLIRNLSETGAGLELTNPVALPDEFTLLIKPELLKRFCIVAWRKGQKVGVRFK